MLLHLLRGYIVLALVSTAVLFFSVVVIVFGQDVLF